jgi:LacI family transcriptional regulator
VSDDAGGSRLAVEHLLELGRTRFAVVTGPAHHRAAATRAEAATDALVQAGLQPALPARFGEWSEAWGRRAVAGLPAGQVDAVVCGSDQVARGVVDGLRESGRRVPDDVAVVGFDNWEVMATASRPPLTTVDMRLQSLGQRAAGLLLDSIDGRPSAGVHPMPCALVVRGSTQSA